MDSSDTLFTNIGKLGDEYCRKYLNEWDKHTLEQNWWEALKFFFSKSFMRGRRDKLSNEYNLFAVEILNSYFEISKDDLDRSYYRLQAQTDEFDIGIILNFKRQNRISTKNSITHSDFFNEIAQRNPLIIQLISKRPMKIIWDNKACEKDVFLGNDADLMMVLDVLKYISSSEGRKNKDKSLVFGCTSRECIFSPILPSSHREEV